MSAATPSTHAARCAGVKYRYTSEGASAPSPIHCCDAGTEPVERDGMLYKCCKHCAYYARLNMMALDPRAAREIEEPVRAPLTEPERREAIAAQCMADARTARFHGHASSTVLGHVRNYVSLMRSARRLRAEESHVVCCGIVLPDGVGKYGCPNCGGDNHP